MPDMGDNPGSTKPCAASIRPSEVFFLKEFLVEARAETGDTCLNTMIENLKELITIEDSMPGTFSATVMFNIRIAHSGLVVLAVAMEGPI